jgi:hypothetical protein
LIRLQFPWLKVRSFALDVVLSGGQNVHSVPLQVAYDKQGLQLLNISRGKFLSQGEQVVGSSGGSF